MRWVALLLLVANAGLIGWQLAGAPGRPTAGVTAPPELGELRLLDEARRQSADESAGACFTIGPFEDPDRAREARARLDVVGVDPRQRSTAEEEAYGYQILLPPFDSTADALDATRELARKGIQDYFIISTESELKNAVSVGLFQERRFAERHVDYLEELGFEPEMRLRTRSRTRYWQDYRDPEGDVTAEVIESLAADGPLKRLERDCADRS